MRRPSQRSETALLARLRHPHVLQFFGCSFSSSGRCFISPRLSDRAVPPRGGCRAATAQFVSFTEGADDPSIWDDLPAPDGATLREMMLAMAACHSVLLEADGDQARTHPPNARTPL